MRNALLFVILVISCSPKILHNKTLYQAELEIKKTDNALDTVKVVFWDYLTLYDHKIYKKDSTVVADNVRRYKFLNKKEILIR